VGDTSCPSFGVWTIDVSSVPSSRLLIPTDSDTFEMGLVKDLDVPWRTHRQSDVDNLEEGQVWVDIHYNLEEQCS
jgi:hypothetical protein